MRRKISLVILGLILCSPFAFASGWQKPKNKLEQRPTPAPPSKTPDAKPPATKAPPPADDQWALLVGISEYPGQIQKLGFPRSDARAIKDLLVGSAGFREDHVRLLTDDGQGDAKATKQNILAAVDSLAPRVQPGHQVIVFLAGHGIVRGLGSQAKGYFLPVDIDAQSKESLERTGLDLEELSRHLSALKAAPFTMFIYACREDPFPGLGLKGKHTT